MLARVRRIGCLAQDQAQQVRPVFGLAPASAVADPFDAHEWQRPVGLCVPGHQQRARRRGQLAVASSVDRHALDESRGRRRWHWERAVRHRHRAAAQVQWRRHHAFHAEPRQAKDTADDVNDRVHCANLVKVHLLDRSAVRAGFHLGKAPEQARCAFLHSLVEPTLLEDRQDVREPAMVVMPMPVPLGFGADHYLNPGRPERSTPDNGAFDAIVLEG